jgi:hypothetical protein
VLPQPHDREPGPRHARRRPLPPDKATHGLRRHSPPTPGPPRPAVRPPCQHHQRPDPRSATTRPRTQHRATPFRSAQRDHPGPGRASPAVLQPRIPTGLPSGPHPLEAARGRSCGFPAALQGKTPQDPPEQQRPHKIRYRRQRRTRSATWRRQLPRIREGRLSSSCGAGWLGATTPLHAVAPRSRPAPSPHAVAPRRRPTPSPHAVAHRRDRSCEVRPSSGAEAHKIAASSMHASANLADLVRLGWLGRPNLTRSERWARNEGNAVERRRRQTTTRSPAAATVTARSSRDAVGWQHRQVTARSGGNTVGWQHGRAATRLGGSGEGAPSAREWPWGRDGPSAPPTWPRPSDRCGCGSDSRTRGGSISRKRSEAACPPRWVTAQAPWPCPRSRRPMR